MHDHVGLRHVVLIIVLFAALVGLAAGSGVLAAAPAAPLGPQQTTCSWQGIGNASEAVYYAASAMDTTNHHLYTYGGLDQSLGARNTVQRIDLSVQDVTKAPHSKISGVASLKRFGASGAFRTSGTEPSVYFIGGAGDSQKGAGTDDVQVYSVTTKKWSSLSTGGALEGRLFHGSVYDPVHDVIWVAGGIAKCGLDDIANNRCVARTMATKYLAFDPLSGAATWHVLSGTTGPTALYGHVMVYDTTAHRVIVIGGTRDGRSGGKDVWQLDLSDADPANAKWSKLSPTGANLPSVALHAGAFDANRNWVVVYGGVLNNFNSANENTNTATYALDLAPNPPQWINLSTSLRQRVGAVAAYDANHKLVVLSTGRRAANASPPQDVERNSSVLVCTDQPTVIPPPVTSGPTETPVPGQTATDTPSIPPPVTATPTTTGPGAGGQACSFIQRFNRVPPQVIADALANPDKVYGWQMRCNPSIPPGPFNRPRTYLSLLAIDKPYHPMFNPLVYKCGCP